MMQGRVGRAPSRVTKAAFVLILVTGSLTAQEPLTFEGGKISLVPPPDFQALTEAEIKVKYARGNPPRYVIANERASVSIAISVMSTPLTPQQLPAFKTVMEQLLPQAIPGLSWITRRS
jgi:hypothetical protein